MEVLDMTLRQGKEENFTFCYHDKRLIPNARDYYEVSCVIAEGTKRYHLWLELSVDAGEQVIQTHKLKEFQRPEGTKIV